MKGSFTKTKTDSLLFNILTISTKLKSCKKMKKLLLVSDIPALTHCLKRHDLQRFLVRGDRRQLSLK